MKLIIKKINGVQGLVKTTYAVFNAETKKCLKICLTKKEADDFVRRVEI